MDSVMIRFLSSIGLQEKADSFDLAFTKIRRSPSNRNQVLMEMRKSSPWDYRQLIDFQTGLLNINYPYELSFCCESKPSPENALALFGDWYLDRVASQCDFKTAKSGDSSILFTFSSSEQQEKEAGNVHEFQSLLVWLGYQVSVSSEVLSAAPEVEEAKSGAEELPEPVSEEAAEEANDEPFEESAFDDSLASLSNDEIQAQIQREFEQNQEKGEEILMEQLLANQKAMEEERNKKRLFSVGDYQIIEKLEDIESAGLVNVDFSGEVFQVESRTTKTGRKMVTFGVGDSTDAISVRALESKRLALDKLSGVKNGMNIRVRGAIDVDYRGQKEVMAHFIDPLPPKPLRDDPEEEKRIELHLHTKMSTMDGVAEMGDYYNLAKHMGMKAIAVTDHGVVQGFPAAQAAHDADAKRIKKNNLDEKPLKIIYGAELYAFDLKQNYIFNPCDKPLREARYCVFDTETTGLSARYERIIEFGGVIVEKGRVLRRFDTFIRPDIPLEHAQEAMAINHITNDDLANAPTMEEVLPQILEFLGDNILVAHNATFDIGMLNAALERNKEAHPDTSYPDHISNPIVDTLPLSHYLFPLAGRHNEQAMLKNLGLNVYDASKAHRADYDSECLNDGWQEIILRLEKDHPGIRHCDAFR